MQASWSQQADAILIRFAHAEDSSAANRDAGLAHVRDGPQTVVVDSGGDDFSVEFGRRIEIVVVGASGPASFSRTACDSVSMPSVQQTSMSQRRNAAHHFQHTVELFALGDLPPRRTHAESRGSFRFGALRGNAVTSAGFISSCLATSVL